jgi:hypothetical protein
MLWGDGRTRGSRLPPLSVEDTCRILKQTACRVQHAEPFVVG